MVMMGIDTVPLVGTEEEQWRNCAVTVTTSKQVFLTPSCGMQCTAEMHNHNIRRG